jgi:dTDP-4-amino-4,6-dideoxygalactose transaminase
MIPLVDLKAEYLSIKNEIDNAISSCISEASFIRGNSVFDFEKAFADYIGVKHCISCGNGTDALEIILKALNIRIGDEVLVPALTWISTAEAVSNLGAIPVFVEVCPETYTIDCNRIEEKLTKKTKAIIPVHLYGCPADMAELQTIAKKYNLFIVEDCAQSHGAEYQGKKTGSFGIASGFSFFPSKNLGAYGDAGAVITDNDDVAEMARKISNHGQLVQKHKHFLIGRNSRLDTIQASILSVKLKFLDDWNSKRQQIAARYKSQLADIDGLVLPYSESDNKHVYHQYVIRCKNRANLIRLLDEKNIAWGIHYPAPLPFIDAYKDKNLTYTDFQVSLAITEEITSIPVFPQMTLEQQEIICKQIQKYKD